MNRRRNPHRPLRTAWLVLLASAGLAAQTPRVFAADAPAAAGAPGVKLAQAEGKVLVEVGGKPFTEYRYSPDADKAEKGKDGQSLPWARPYFYPVRAADGVEVTSDQSRTNAKEHPHHRSLWVAQGLVNGMLEHWTHAKAGQPQPEQRHVGFDKIDGDTIVERLTWDGKDGKPMLNETRTWRFSAYPDGGRAVDLTSVYTATAGPVTFGDTKEAGLCSVRLVKSIADTSVITLSTGVQSTKEANKAKKEPGDESKVWGKPADWCDLSGKIEGKDYGVAVFDHPENPRHPSTWHVRRYGLLSANIFGLHDFDPKKYAEKTAGDLTLEPGKPVTFKYRVVVHAGDAEAAKLKEKYEAYVAGK
jgi:hypothetical protein